MDGTASSDLRRAMELGGLLQGSTASMALTRIRELGSIQELFRNPMLDMVRTLKENQDHWQKSWSNTLVPFSLTSKVIADSNHSLLVNLQRDMRQATDLLRENALGKSITAIMKEQQWWKTIRMDMGLTQWAESITQTQKQWSGLADLAGLSARIRRDTFGPLIALQRDLLATYNQEQDWGRPCEPDTTLCTSTMTPEQVQGLLNETLETQLVPVLLELKNLRSEVADTRAKVLRGDNWKLVPVLWLLFQIIGILASLDGWRLAMSGKQGNALDFSLTPENAQQLRESMEYVIAFGQQLLGSERIVIRGAQLRRTPKGALLPQKVCPGQVFQVLEERHEWIAVGFEAGDEWISGWLLKKYTRRTTAQDPRDPPVIHAPMMDSTTRK